MSSLPPSRRDRLRPAIAQVGLVAVAACGGLAGARAGLPAGWMIGSMLVTVLLSAFGRTPVLAVPLRDLAMLLAGMSMGSAVTPESLGAFVTYPASLAIMTVAVVAILAAGTGALVLVSGWSARDAFFASAPGGLSTVLMIAAEVKADVARIAIVQLFRLFILVAVLPMALSLLDHADVSGPGFGPPADAVGLALLFSASLTVSVLFERWGIAGAFILGSMAASAALTGPGLVSGAVPAALAIVGFVLIGIFIGQRFRGFDGMAVLRTLPAAVVCLVASLAVAWGFAALVTAVVGQPIGDTVVAFAPGAIEAMTVLAFTLGLDPVYVALHHLARFVLVAIIVPLAMRLFPGLSRPPVD
jgi:hypothetical protein